MRESIDPPCPECGQSMFHTSQCSRLPLEPEGVGVPVHDATREVLAERGARYGRFDSHAAIAQRLKADMAVTPNWGRLAPDQREALEMIQHKVARILNGDPDYEDSWRDIAGYATLVADRLKV